MGIVYAYLLHAVPGGPRSRELQHGLRHHDAVTLVAHHRSHKTATIVAPDPPNSAVGTVVVDAPSLFSHCYHELCVFPEDTTVSSSRARTL